MDRWAERKHGSVRQEDVLCLRLGEWGGFTAWFTAQDVQDLLRAHWRAGMTTKRVLAGQVASTPLTDSCSCSLQATWELGPDAANASRPSLSMEVRAFEPSGQHDERHTVKLDVSALMSGGGGGSDAPAAWVRIAAMKEDVRTNPSHTLASLSTPVAPPQTLPATVQRVVDHGVTTARAVLVDGNLENQQWHQGATLFPQAGRHPRVALTLQQAEGTSTPAAHTMHAVALPIGTGLSGREFALPLASAAATAAAAAPPPATGTGMGASAAGVRGRVVVALCCDDLASTNHSSGSLDGFKDTPMLELGNTVETLMLWLERLQRAGAAAVVLVHVRVGGPPWASRVLLEAGHFTNRLLSLVVALAPAHEAAALVQAAEAGGLAAGSGQLVHFHEGWGSMPAAGHGLSVSAAAARIMQRYHKALLHDVMSALSGGHDVAAAGDQSDDGERDELLWAMYSAIVNPDMPPVVGHPPLATVLQRVSLQEAVLLCARSWPRLTTAAAVDVMTRTCAPTVPYIVPRFRRGGLSQHHRARALADHASTGSAGLAVRMRSFGSVLLPSEDGTKPTRPTFRDMDGPPQVQLVEWPQYEADVVQPWRAATSGGAALCQGDAFVLELALDSFDLRGAGAASAAAAADTAAPAEAAQLPAFAIKAVRLERLMPDGHTWQPCVAVTPHRDTPLPVDVPAARPEPAGDDDCDGGWQHQVTGRAVTVLCVFNTGASAQGAPSKPRWWDKNSASIPHSFLCRNGPQVFRVCLCFDSAWHTALFFAHNTSPGPPVEVSPSRFQPSCSSFVPSLWMVSIDDTKHWQRHTITVASSAESA